MSTEVKAVRSNQFSGQDCSRSIGAVERFEPATMLMTLYICICRNRRVTKVKSLSDQLMPGKVREGQQRFETILVLTQG